MVDPITDPLREEIEQFLRLTGMSPTRFSESATRDSHFVRHLRKGRRVWPDTADRVRQFMRSYDPATERPLKRRYRPRAQGGASA